MAVVRGLFGATMVGGLLWAAPVLAQTGTLTGKIIDSTSQLPLAAVAVRLEGTQRGTQTRDDGSFVLAVVPTGRQSLRVTRIGYASKLQPVTVNPGSNTVPTIQLRQLAATLQEVVSVGYGTQRRNAVTSAVSTVNTAEARVGVQPNVNQLIQGRAAGVQVTGNGGDPGAGAQIRIRGGSSISASDQPLYVIDGVPILNQADQPGGIGITGGSTPVARSPLNTLNPDDIAEISILKDASATAIYGSRGANGVVLITTKKGVAGTSTLVYNGYYGAASAAKTLDVLSAAQFRNFIQQNVTNGVFSQSQLSTLGTANTDWQSSILRTAQIQDHNLSFSGGSQAAQYRASVNYFDNPGIVIGSGLTRYQGRVNGTSQLLDSKLTLNLNLTASQVANRYLAAEGTGGFAGGVFINAVQFNPTLPIYGNTTNGASPFTEVAAGSQQQRNPFALTQQINDRGTTTRVLGNVQANYAFLTGLTGTVNVGFDRSNGNRATYGPTNSPLSAGVGGDAYIGTLTLNGATVQTLLTYDRPFEYGFLGRQTINVVGGYEYQNYSNANTSVERRGFVTDANGANNIGVGSDNSVPPSSYLEYRKLSSFFARANYGIQDRYFLTGVVRRDGASVFGANNKYAVFPSVSASWRLSEEPWFYRAGIINDLRLRGGYGTQGNQGISPYQTLATLAADPNQRYPFGGTLITGVLPNQNPNPNLKWETTAQADVALDYGLFKNRVTGSLEYYSKTTRDLLLTINVPQPAVVATQLQNIGRVKNAGFEGNADFQVINTPGRTLSLGLVVSSNRNKVLSLGNSITRLFTGFASGQGFSAVQSQVIVPGQPLGTFYGPVFVRPGGTADGANNGLDLCNDYNAQGAVTGLISCSAANAIDQDKKYLGNANPKLETGFRGQANIGKFDASFLFRASTGFKDFNNTAAVYSSKSNATTGRNFLASGLTDGLGVITSGTSQSYAGNSFSSRFIESGDFLRLQNVTLGYTLNLRSLFRRSTTARIYVSGDNLFLATKYSGLDPEVFTDATLNGYTARGIDYLSYPRARTFTFGTRLGL